MEKGIKIVLAAILFMLNTAVFAQSTESNEERSVFIELGASVGQYIDGRYKLVDDVWTRRYEHKAYGIILPGIGYKINQRFNVGFNLGIEAGENRYQFTPRPIFYGQYNFFHNEKFNIFIEPKFSFAKYKMDWDYSNYDPNNPGKPEKKYSDWFFEGGVSFGMNYALTKRLKLQLRYIQIGYTHAPYFEYPAFNHARGCLGNGRWSADFGLRRLELSIRYIFPRKEK